MIIRVARAAGAVAVVVIAVVFGVTGAAPAMPGEAIRSYDTRIDVRADGDLAVVETIVYDFVTGQHGIYGKVPVRYRYNDTHDRVYPIMQVTAAMDDAVVPFVQSSKGGYTLILIGDPNLTVTGSHTYVIRYTVRGALNHFADHEELYAEAYGTRRTGRGGYAA